jgi:hypothetical protein
MLVERRWGTKQSRLVAGANASVRMRALAKRRGYARGYPIWTAAEDDILRADYPDYDLLQKRLPRRTYEAIRGRLRALKIQKVKRPWTCKEVLRLRKLWPHADRKTLLDAFPECNWHRLSNAARLHKLRRPHNPFSSTGDPLLDSIRARCRYLNYSMGDLDKMAGTADYFRSAGWRRHAPSTFKMVKAIKSLGGKISVSWDE